MTVRQMFPTGVRTMIPDDYLKKKDNFSRGDMKSPDLRNMRSRKQLNTLNNLNLTF